MMRRGSMKGRRPMGAAARRRLRRGGPRATGRAAATLAEWAGIRETVFARAHWSCQACGGRGRLDVHHVTKRAQGGSDFDFDQLVTLCRPCHEWTDAAYVRGRLVVTPRGAGRFAFALVCGRKGATEVLDQWESLWPPSGEPSDGSGSGLCPCGQTHRSAAGEAFPPTPPPGPARVSASVSSLCPRGQTGSRPRRKSRPGTGLSQVRRKRRVDAEDPPDEPLASRELAMSR